MRPGIIIIVFLFFLVPRTGAQFYKIRGTVFDSTRNYPLEAVSVLTTSGRGTATNAKGVYEIEVTEKDSIWFSYLNKPTIKFPVLQITNPLEFDISILINIPTMKEVRLPLKDYKRDSIQNRADYAKIFNFRKPTLRTATNYVGLGAGFDLDELINMFRFRRTRSMLSFQKRLMQEERDKFVDHRFNKPLLKRLTPLEGSELDSFMRIYRPTYAFAQIASDYEFQEYIKLSLKRFRNGLPPDPYLKEED